MSWNIEKLGSEKAFSQAIPQPGQPQPPPQFEILNFIAYTILTYDVDIAGLMEIVSGDGDRIKDTLLGILNNLRPQNAPYEWQGRASEMQLGGTGEQYIYLWKQQEGRIEIDMNRLPIFPLYLKGYLGDDSFYSIFDPHGPNSYSEEDQNDFNNVLSQQGYMDRDYNVPVTMWHTLATTPTPVALPGLRRPLLHGQAEIIKKIIVHAEPIKFPGKRDFRCPYIGHFLINGASRLTTALYHAPGPEDKDHKYKGINNIGLVPELADKAENCLVMGDFNVEHGDDTEAPVMGIFEYPKDSNMWVFRNVIPAEKKPVFDPIVNNPLHLVKQLPDNKTSLSSNILPMGTYREPAFSHSYDNFFYRQGTANSLQSANPEVMQMLDIINAGAPLPNMYSGALAQLAYRFFMIFKGLNWIQNKIQTKSGLTDDEINYLKNYLTFFSDPTNGNAAEYGSAFLIYRKAISDHLPITITLG